MHRKVALVVGAFVLAAAVSSMADEVLLSELYGSGVHAFNRGDDRAAHADLTAAIQGGSNDPRSYYFRGLVYLRLGREQEAIGDFEKGAGYETSESAGVYSVGRSLERIQGPARQLLERYRSTARITAHKRQAADRQLQYQQRVAAENEVLRKAPPAELPSAPSGAVPPATVPSADANDPFGAPMPTPSERGRPAPPAESESPFAPTETPPMTPAESDPFGAPAPAAPPAAEAAPMPAENADPFGSDTPTPTPPADDKPMPEGDPFGAPPTPAPAETPAATPPATGAGASVKPTRNGLSGLFKSIVGAAPGRGLAGGGAEGSPSGGIFSGLPNLSIPLPGGIGGSPGNGDLGDIPPSAPLGDDPLGSPPPASTAPAPMPMPPGNAEDPFGPPSGSAPATPAPVPKPAEPKPAEEDPFGPPAGGATPPSPTPMPKPAEGEDPFGPSPPASNDQPAPSPTPSDDPFAN